MSLLQQVREKISGLGLLFVGGSVIIAAILFPRLFGNSRQAVSGMFDSPYANADTPASCAPSSAASGDCVSSGDVVSDGGGGCGDSGDSGGSSG